MYNEHANFNYHADFDPRYLKIFRNFANRNFLQFFSIDAYGTYPFLKISIDGTYQFLELHSVISVNKFCRTSLKFRSFRTLEVLESAIILQRCLPSFRVTLRNVRMRILRRLIFDQKCLEMFSYFGHSSSPCTVIQYLGRDACAATPSAKCLHMYYNSQKSFRKFRHRNSPPSSAL